MSKVKRRTLLASPLLALVPSVAPAVTPAVTRYLSPMLCRTDAGVRVYTTLKYSRPGDQVNQAVRWDENT